MCDMPDAFREKERTARRDHKCCECHGTIAVGSKYVYTSGVWDGQGRDCKTCLRCARVRSDGYRFAYEPDEGPPLGGLADWLIELAADVDQPMKGGLHSDVIERGAALLQTELAKKKAKSTRHWRDGAKTAHQNCSICLSMSRFDTTACAAAPQDAERDGGNHATE